MSASRVRRHGATRGASTAAQGGSPPAAVRFAVRVQPRASTDGLAGFSNGTLRVRLQAPPVDGAANDALIAFLAETFGVARRDVRIVAGHTSRSKIVEIDGIDPVALERLGQSL